MGRTLRAAGRASLAAGVVIALGLVAPGISAATPAGPFPEGVPPSGGGGTVAAWGADDFHQTDLPASLSGRTVTAVSAGYRHSLALTSDGMVTGWGTDFRGDTRPPAVLRGKTVTAIAAGTEFSVALTSDGRVTAWGDDYWGETDVPATLSGTTVTAVAAGGGHALALTAGGTVVGWGEDRDGENDVPASLAGKRVTAIAAGTFFSLALTSDGTVTAWGSDYVGETDVPASLAGKQVTAIATGTTHALAISADGAVTAWGRDVDGEVDVPASLAGKRVVAVAGGAGSSLALTSDGVLTAWGDDTYHQADVPGALAGKALAVAAGEGFAVAIGRPGTDFRAPVITATYRGTTVKSLDPDGAVVNYDLPTAYDAVDGPVPVTCTPPPGSFFPNYGSNVHCSATDAAGNTATLDLIVYVRPVPTRVVVGAISPTSGPVTGGTIVTVTGHGFTGTKYVGFGDQHTTEFTVVSDTMVTVVAPPAERAGFVHVFLHGHGYSVGRPVDKFHYLPDITGVSPSRGTAGTMVTITGHGFTGARSVTFGSVPATSFTVVSDTRATAVAPTIGSGTVDVRVAVPGGTTAITAADRYQGV